VKSSVLPLDQVPRALGAKLAAENALTGDKKSHPRRGRKGAFHPSDSAGMAADGAGPISVAGGKYCKHFHASRSAF